MKNGRHWRLVFVAAISGVCGIFGGCGNDDETPQPLKAESSRPYVAVLSKGFQYQFWQIVYAGSKAAAEKNGVEISFEGPISETDAAMQVKMLAAIIAKKPAAICLAALDPQTAGETLRAVKNFDIPVVAFDASIANAPADVIVASVLTNNYAAGALAAEEMFKEISIQARLESATTAAPLHIGVLSQDNLTASVVDRTRGFVKRLRELTETQFPDAVAITGNSAYAVASAKPATLIIEVLIAATANHSDLHFAANNLLRKAENLGGIFCTNEGVAFGLLSATGEGADLDRVSGKYKNLTIIGFDSGAAQKNAVARQYFYGAITQDPFQIGYLTVEAAARIIRGEHVPPQVDTGCHFYTHENITSPEISALLYD